MKKKSILLTNDDGYFSEGINSLYNFIKSLGDTYIVAPDREMSATSLSLTLHNPLRAKKIEPHVFAVQGTPADCIYLAVRVLLPKKPDMIISGFNHGPNLGQQDISYSGTVAAAFQGTFLGIPSIAISLIRNQKGKFHFQESGDITLSIVKKLLDHSLPPGLTLNINIPTPPFKGIKITNLGIKRYNPEIIENKDPRKNQYFWIGMSNPKAQGDKNSDVHIIKEGYITITPLQNDLTDYKSISLLQKMFKGIKD